MATNREGSKTILLVVDVQVGVLDRAWEAGRVIDNVSTAVERARSQGVPVFWVQHSDDDLVYGGPDWQWVPQLVPAGNEVRIHKKFESSFEQTMLEQELSGVSATHIVLAGASTNWCIRATAYAALERGYDLTLIKDAHTTRDLDLGNGDSVAAAGMIQDLNVVMSWIRYPGRRSDVVTAQDLDFSSPGPAH